MDGIVETFKNFFSFLWRNKALIALIPVMAIAWIPVIFPYGDLRAVVATTGSRAIGEGIAIDFEHVSIVPGFPVAIKVEELEFTGPGLPAISADRVVASPSISSIFTRNPAGSLEAEGISIPSVSIPLGAFGSIVTPLLQLGRVDLKGQMSQGKIQIENFSFGQPTNALSGRVHGEIGVGAQKDAEPGGRARTVIGPFDLKVELTITKPLMDAMNKSGAAAPLMFVEAFKKMNGETTGYSFGVKGETFGPPPQYYALEASK